MSEYNQYVTAINKIFDYLEKIKAGWQSLDNSNYIESIEEYKPVIIKNAEVFKTAPSTENTPEKVEALGNDW